MLRDEFLVRQQEMQRETIEHVALQSQIVVREASAEIHSRRSELADEWQTHQYRSQLAVEEVEQNSRILVAEVEANVADQYRLTAYQAVSQLEVAHSHRDRESRQAYALLERHALEQDLVLRTEMELQVQRREALHTELVQANANSNLLVSRAQVESNAARNVDRGNMQRRLVSFESTEQQRQLQLRQQLQQRLDDEQQQLLRAQASASSIGTELAGLQQHNAVMVSELDAHRREELVQRDEMQSWKAMVQQAVSQIQDDADSVEAELRAELDDARLQIRQAASTGVPSSSATRSNIDARLIADLRAALAEARSEHEAAQDEANEYGQMAWNYEAECNDLQERFVEFEEDTAEAKTAPAASFRIHTPDHVPQRARKQDHPDIGKGVGSILDPDRSIQRDSGPSVLSNPNVSRGGSLPGQGVGLTMRSLLSGPSIAQPTTRQTRDASRVDIRRDDDDRHGDDDGDDDSSSSDGASKARSRKQVSKIDINLVPQASGFRQLVLDLNTAVIAASRRPRHATMRWLNTVQTATSLAQVEHVHAKWDDLDAELAASVLRISSGPLKRELTL